MHYSLFLLYQELIRPMGVISSCLYQCGEQSPKWTTVGVVDSGYQATTSNEPMMTQFIDAYMSPGHNELTVNVLTHSGWVTYASSK